MKKLKRLKLQNAVALQEKEMKTVRGGGVFGCPAHGACSGHTCFTDFGQGTCEPTPFVFGLCACVVRDGGGGYDWWGY